MKKFSRITFIFCGLLLQLAAFPVFAQEKSLSKELDFGDFVIEKVDKDKVNLSAPFLLELEVLLTKDGKLDLNSIKISKSEGDSQVIEIIKRALKEGSNDGFFKALRDLEAEKVKIALSQNNSELYGNISFDQKTLEKAKTAASGLKLLFDASNLESNDEEEIFFAKGISINNVEKSVSINFNFQKSVIQKYINQALDSERKEQTVKGVNFNEVKSEAGKDLFGSSVVSLVDELNTLSQQDKFDWNLKGNFQIDGLGFSEGDNSRSLLGGGSLSKQVYLLMEDSAAEIARSIFIKKSNLGLGDFYSESIDYIFTVENGELIIKAAIENKNEKDARILADELKKNVNSFSSKNREKFVAERTEITSNDEQVFITINLPRTSLDAIIKSGW